MGQEAVVEAVILADGLLQSDSSSFVPLLLDSDLRNPQYRFT